MNNKIIGGAIAAIILISIASYFLFGTNDKALVGEVFEPSPTSESIDELLEDMASSFTVGQREETYYQMVGAYDGTKVDVDGIKVEIYQYKENQEELIYQTVDSFDTVDNRVISYGNFIILTHSPDIAFMDSIIDEIRN
jgi:hypothetical protein